MKHYRIIKHILTLITFTSIFSIAGCVDYLDKSPEASINETDAFRNFVSFQGFTEELYCCIVDPSKAAGPADCNLADELKCNVTYFLLDQFDAGDYWKWSVSYGSFFDGVYGAGIQTSPTDPKRKGYWPLSWYGIRKANQGLANLDKLIGTQEEKDLIKGQLLFFRGFFYFELMKWWGGMPYLDRVLSPSEEMKFPRLNYRETALRAAKDFDDAAQLLPIDWDDLEAGKRTLGNNRQRINKIMAYSLKGKNLLYAASPLMNRESTGNATYDEELCKSASEAFSKIINLCEGANPPYSLQPWTSYTDMFYTITPTRILPGGVEVIMNPPMYDHTFSIFAMANGLGFINNISQQFGVCNNYVQNWGMSNGLPITDEASGYNNADPWSNRDPRFYKTIVVDGDQICNSTAAGVDRFAQLYTGGRHRLGAAANVTGFLTRKYWNNIVNKFDNGNNGSVYQFLPPIMRLSDVYLMYAESVLNGYGSSQSNFPGCITAETAINRVRNRALLPNIDSKYTASKSVFMEEIIRERAVELSFEGHRLLDLRRWLIAGQKKYKEKTELIFERDPITGKPVNMQERILVTRVFDERNYWLPLPTNQVSLYADFKQNPGW